MSSWAPMDATPNVTVAPATSDDAGDLALVAGACFPLACPPSVPAGDVAAFIAANLSARRFAGYLADPTHQVLAARCDGRIVGYAMLISGADGDTELSKMYVLEQFHHRGVAAQLMRRAVDRAREDGAGAVWLGVNRDNTRAQRFYRKHGFTVTGTRSFQVGETLETDFIMRRLLREPTP